MAAIDDFNEARKWAGECCAWSIDGSSELHNSRLRLLEELRDAAFNYGIEVGRKKAEGINWVSGIEQNRLHRLVQEAMRNIESQIGAFILAYPGQHREMLTKALLGARDAIDLIDQIHDLTGQFSTR